MKPTCSWTDCDTDPTEGRELVLGRPPRYCRTHQAEYMREWRKTHPPSEESRRRSNCRAYTKVLINRGHLVRQPCQVCGGPAAESEAHHPDYDQPRWVVWLCRRDHLDWHHPERKVARETLT